MATIEEAKLAAAAHAAFSAYVKTLLDQLNGKVNSLAEELKTRDLSPEEAAGLRKVINDLADLPGVLPEG
ncbi:MAG TPA: hypothetical protein VMW46_03265 [Candidatus Desulfaltia sp.]|nr:hypothetical protein [Candidatus Desulfaltia sp.]